MNRDMPLCYAAGFESDFELFLMQCSDEFAKRLQRRLTTRQHNPAYIRRGEACISRNCSAIGSRKALIGSQRFTDVLDFYILIAAPCLFRIAEGTAHRAAVQSNEDHRHSGHCALALHGGINI